MPNHTHVATFTVQHLQYLDENGNPTQPLPDFALNKDAMIDCYRWMCLARAFDQKAINLQRTGRLGTFAPAIGQEAVMVGIGKAMAADDILCPYYRDHGAYMQRGVTLTELFQYWGGDEQGCAFAHNQQDLPPCIPIATQTLHAAGIATALKYQQQPHAVLTTCGDGATSKGDFYEALNIAGLWYLPLVFVINNNGWAISIPRSQQTGAQTLAQKAIAGGVPCLQVDGNDIVAVISAVTTALVHAREGKGAMVIEALTFRLCDHTTADDASRYQPHEKVDAARAQEPLIRTRAFLETQFGWDEHANNALLEACTEDVEGAATAYCALPPPTPESMFDHLFETLPPHLAHQRQALIQRRAQKEERHG